MRQEAVHEPERRGRARRAGAGRVCHAATLAPAGRLDGDEGDDAKKYQEEAVEEASAEPRRPEDYQIVLHWSADDACYIATMPAWQNARTHGKTVEEASRNARDVLSMLIASAAREGTPCPAVQTRYSGNLRLRLPVSLHERVAREAEREGVSLNQWLVARIAG